MYLNTLKTKAPYFLIPLFCGICDNKIYIEIYKQILFQRTLEFMIEKDLINNKISKICQSRWMGTKSTHCPSLPL